MIKFEVIEGYNSKLPVRATKGSAGYDFYNTDKEIIIPPHGTVIIETGIKVYMDTDIVLLIYNRSSLSIKRGITIVNQTAVIDSDYLKNIIIPLQNNTDEPRIIEPYERIAQGIFTKFYLTEDDNVDAVRDGGIGSTGTK